MRKDRRSGDTPLIPHTLVLRYGNAEEPTIERHSEIVDREGYTWWGWWKKTWEPFPKEALEFLARTVRDGTLQVGLVSRKEEPFELAVARCAGIQYHEDGRNQRSPEDGAFTPEYYRDHPDGFPAWFKFDRLRRVEREEFLGLFGVIPNREPTFYDVKSTRQGPEAFPRLEWDMSPVPSPGRSILHLSDLHFGPDHGYPLPGDELLGRASPLSLLDVVSRRVKELPVTIGCVVASGDFTTRGDANYLPAARRFLQELLAALGLSERHLVMVPGNHDMWLVDVEHPTRDYAHENPYRDWVNGIFHADEPLVELERVRHYIVPGDRHLVFIELNSVRPRNDALKNYGYVAAHRYRELLEFANRTLRDQGIAAERVFLAVALHHHLIPVLDEMAPTEESPVSVCLDAAAMVRHFQEAGVDAVLHGHQHLPFVAALAHCGGAGDSFPKHPLYLLGSGSAGVTSTRLCEGSHFNSFSVYTPADEGLLVSVQRYLPSTWPTNDLDRTLPWSWGGWQRGATT